MCLHWVDGGLISTALYHSTTRMLGSHLGTQLIHRAHGVLNTAWVLCNCCSALGGLINGMFCRSPALVLPSMGRVQPCRHGACCLLQVLAASSLQETPAGAMNYVTALPTIVANMHDYFVAVAAKLERTHAEVTHPSYWLGLVHTRIFTCDIWFCVPLGCTCTYMHACSVIVHFHYSPAPVWVRVDV